MDMQEVKSFNAELSGLYDNKPPISKAKMSAITRGAIKAIKFYKHVVHSVEKFIQKCKPEYKVPGLYVIDSIVRQSRHQFGQEKDVFAPRFAKNMQQTFANLFRCPPEDKRNIIRVLNLWQKNNVFSAQVIQPLLDMADPNHPLHKEIQEQQNNTANGSSLNATHNTTDSKLSPGPSQHTPHASTPMGNEFQDERSSESNVNFNRKLLNDFEYDSDEAPEPPAPHQHQHHQHQHSQHQHQQSQQSQQSQQHQTTNPADALGSILTNPEIMRQLQSLQAQMQLMTGMQMPNIMPMMGGDSQMQQNQNQIPFMNSQQDQQKQSDSKDDMANESDIEFVETGPQVIEIPDANDSRSPSPRSRRHRSRSKSPKRRRRSRSRSRSPKRRRDRERERERDKEKDTKSYKEREAEKEKQREREKKGLPPIKKDNLSVCSTTLWVGKLSKLATPEELSDLFGGIGGVVSIDVVPPRGCAFVVMERRRDAVKALNKLNKHKLHSKEITVLWAPGRGVKGREWKDYWEAEQGVSYLPWAALQQRWALNALSLDALEDGGAVDEDTLPPWIPPRILPKAMMDNMSLLGVPGVGVVPHLPALPLQVAPPGMPTGLPPGMPPGLPPGIRPPSLPTGVPGLQADGLAQAGGLLRFPLGAPLPAPGALGGFLGGLLGVGGLVPGMPLPMPMHQQQQQQQQQAQAEAARGDDAMELDSEEAAEAPPTLSDQLQALLSKPPPNFNASEPPPGFNLSEPPPFNVSQPPPTDEKQEEDRKNDRERDRRDRDRDRDRRDRDNSRGDNRGENNRGENRGDNNRGDNNRGDNNRGDNRGDNNRGDNNRDNRRDRDSRDRRDRDRGGRDRDRERERERGDERRPSRERAARERRDRERERDRERFPRDNNNREERSREKSPRTGNTEQNSEKSLQERLWEMANGKPAPRSDDKPRDEFQERERDRERERERSEERPPLLERPMLHERPPPSLDNDADNGGPSGPPIGLGGPGPGPGPGGPGPGPGPGGWTQLPPRMPPPHMAAPPFRAELRMRGPPRPGMAGPWIDGPGPGPGGPGGPPGVPPGFGPRFNGMGPPPFNRPPFERPPFEGGPIFDGPPRFERPPFNRMPFDGMNRPPFDGPRPPGGPRPPFDGSRPPFDGPRPSFDGPRQFEGERPPFDGPPMFDGPPDFFDRNNRRFDDREQFNNERGWNGDRDRDREWDNNRDSNRRNNNEWDDRRRGDRRNRDSNNEDRFRDRNDRRRNFEDRPRPQWDSRDGPPKDNDAPKDVADETPKDAPKEITKDAQKDERKRDKDRKSRWGAAEEPVLPSEDQIQDVIEKIHSIRNENLERLEQSKESVLRADSKQDQLGEASDKSEPNVPDVPEPSGDVQNDENNSYDAGDDKEERYERTVESEPDTSQKVSEQIDVEPFAPIKSHADEVTINDNSGDLYDANETVDKSFSLPEPEPIEEEPPIEKELPVLSKEVSPEPVESTKEMDIFEEAKEAMETEAEPSKEAA